MQLLTGKESGNGIHTSQLISMSVFRFLDAAVVVDQLEIHFLSSYITQWGQLEMPRAPPSRHAAISKFAKIKFCLYFRIYFIAFQS